jgi:hypothetical protein
MYWGDLSEADFTNPKKCSHVGYSKQNHKSSKKENFVLANKIMQGSENN